MTERTGNPGLARFAWTVLAYNLLVIAWGAFVRASGSGAGCGKHWPLCNGMVVPREPSTATLIEVSHRVTSGLALVLVVVLLVLVLRNRDLPKRHPARRAAKASTFFMFTEALVGAGLVLFELVAHDASMKRGLSMILHLSNTFLLLGSLAVTAWSLTPKAADDHPRASSALVKPALWSGIVGVLLLGSSGAIAALGDTLFPAHSLSDGLAQDMSPLAHVFLRLRVLHPFLALAVGALVFAGSTIARVTTTSPRVRLLSRIATLAFATQFAAGLLNLFLLAPIPMQLVHLLLADATWIALVLLLWEAIYARDQEPIKSRKGPAPISEVPPSTSNVEPVT
ncbi:MAG: COX15/CtaA family protein [Deltaproteobacteria bacterium]|nr:COX15/CtaA family protein [Deltaproteobacteria bacterium]